MYKQSHHWGKRRDGIHTRRNKKMIINLLFLQSNQINSICDFALSRFLFVSSEIWGFPMCALVIFHWKFSCLFLYILTKCHVAVITVNYLIWKITDLIILTAYLHEPRGGSVFKWNYTVSRGFRERGFLTFTVGPVHMLRREARPRLTQLPNPTAL